MKEIEIESGQVVCLKSDSNNLMTTGEEVTSSPKLICCYKFVDGILYEFKIPKSALISITNNTKIDI